MKQVMTKAIKLKAVCGEPTVAIADAVARGDIPKQANGKPALGHVVLLGFVVGKAHEMFMHGRTKENPDGTKNEEKWPALRGDFLAFNAERTLGHRSTTAFLMDHVTRQIGQILADAKEADPDSPAPVLPIAFRVEAITSAQGGYGFEWQLSPLQEMMPDKDPLADLIGLTGGALSDGREDAAQIPHNPETGEVEADETAPAEHEAVAKPHKRK